MQAVMSEATHGKYVDDADKVGWQRQLADVRHCHMLYCSNVPPLEMFCRCQAAAWFDGYVRKQACLVGPLDVARLPFGGAFSKRRMAKS
jgi:hypothetical protein